MKTIVIGAPDLLPPELAENPDVVVIDPATLPEEMMAMLDAATGGMLGEEPLEEVDEEGSGEGDEEDEEEGSGTGDDEEEDPLGGTGDEEDEEEQAGGTGDDEEEDEPAPPVGGSRGKAGGKRGRESFGVTINGRGAAIPPLMQWAKSMGRGAPR